MNKLDHQTNRLTQIGNVCVQWSNLEYQLSVAIWAMARLNPEVGKILTGGMDIKQRAAAAHAIAHTINAPVFLKQAIKDVLAALRDDLISKRNQAVHGVHFPTAQLDEIGIELHRGKGGRGRRVQTDKELFALGDSIKNIALSFNVALASYAETLRKERGKLSERIEETLKILIDIASARDDEVNKGPA